MIRREPHCYDGPALEGWQVAMVDPGNGEPMVTDGGLLRLIANEYGMPAESLWAPSSDLGSRSQESKKLMGARRDAAWRLYREGRTQAEIASTLHRQRSTISRYITAHLQTRAGGSQMTDRTT